MNELTELGYDQIIDKAENKFIQVAPSNIKFASERSFAIQLLNGNDYLMKVAMQNKASFLSAVMNVANVGLSLNPAKKQAYLVPRKGIICFDPSYMGMCDLATMSGSIKWVQARIVYSEDTFTDNGIDKEPTHRCDPFLKERGDIKGAYCTAKTEDGDYLTTTMTIDEIFKIRDKSELWKKNQSGPWKDFEGEQIKKTVVRRSFKMWPKTESMDRLAMAVDISNQNEGFEQIATTSPDLGQFTDEQKKYFDQLIEQSNAVGMFLFIDSIEENVHMNLYHSFEKGTKGKYQKLINELQQSGRATLQDCVSNINESVSNDDDSGILEIIDGVDKAELNYYLENCSDDAAATIRAMEKEAA